MSISLVLFRRRSLTQSPWQVNQLGEFEAVCREQATRCDEKLKVITEAEHVHSTSDRYAQQFDQPKNPPGHGWRVRGFLSGEARFAGSLGKVRRWLRNLRCVILGVDESGERRFACNQPADT